jgi:transposase
MKQEKVYIGIDVAKGHLDVAWEQTCWRVPNDAGGYRELLQRWAQTSGASIQVICEASGGYERGLLLALARGGIDFSLVQASRVRHYARACGLLAKTDSIDAQLLARFGQAIAPPPTKVLPAEHEQLRQLESQRRHLMRLLVAQQNRRAQLNNKTLLRLSSGLMAQLRKQIAQIEALLASSIEQNQELAAKARKLTSIAGVGSRTATLLLAQMPELGQLNRREVAALAGLAPFNRDSGSLQGKRTIFGGRRAVRCGLYMAALVAARHNPILAPFYQRLRRAGKPPKLALTATMRKLLIVLNSTLKPDPIPA